MAAIARRASQHVADRAEFQQARFGRGEDATTISDGEHDEIIKRDHTEMMSLAIPRARLVMLPGVSHFAMLQDPGQFNQALTAFLAA